MVSINVKHVYAQNVNFYSSNKSFLMKAIKKYKTIFNKYSIWFSKHFPFALYDIIPITDILISIFPKWFAVYVIHFYYDSHGSTEAKGL